MNGGLDTDECNCIDVILYIYTYMCVYLYLYVQYMCVSVRLFWLFKSDPCPPLNPLW